MSVEQSILQILHTLPAPARQEVLDFAEFLREKANRPNTPRRSLRGLWAHLGIDVNSEEIAEARRVLWQQFPRDIGA
jgi:hypothetical protein